MPKIDIASVPGRKGSSYPAPFHEIAKDRMRQPLGAAGGLSDFGVNFLTLTPGSASSQRHWHSHEDEFLFVVEGEVVLVEDGGETILKAGDCAAFPKNVANGHQLLNRTQSTAKVIEVGTNRDEDLCTYSDIDMVADARGYRTKDGKPYPPRQS